LVYLLILAMATSWRCALLGDEDVVPHYLDATVIAALGGVIALLSSRWQGLAGGHRAAVRVREFDGAVRPPGLLGAEGLAVFALVDRLAEYLPLQHGDVVGHD
jgi:hypothetical protein